MPENNVLTKDFITAGRFSELDGLRGLAILGVVIYHFGTPYGTYYPSDHAVLYNFAVGEMGVQLFFMISGFVILLSAIKSGSAAKFVLSRTSRLYPTYWAGLIFASILIFTVGIETRVITLPQLLVNFTMLQRFLFVENVDQVYWTLAVEMQFYLLVFAYLLFTKGKLNRVFLTRFAVVWSLLGLTLCLLYPHGSETGLAKILVWLVLAEHSALFCYGISLFLYFYDQKFSPLIALFAGISITNAFVRHDVLHGVTVMTLALLFFFVVWSKNVPWLRQGPLHFMGKISYPWYLVHTVGGFVMIHLLQSYIGVLGSIIVAFCVSILLAYLLHISVETKLSNRFRKILYKTIIGTRKAPEIQQGQR